MNMFYKTPFGMRREETGFHLVKDNWNDFGFSTLFSLFYVDINKNEHHIGYVKIGYKDQEEGHTSLDSNFETLPDNYFSLGDGANYYSSLKKLEEKLGDDLRERCLQGLKDVAYFNDKFHELENTKEYVFITSLLRDRNKNNIKTQLHRIAHGGSVLTNYNFKYQISDVENEAYLHFNVEPESLPPTNIHAIIGTNGSGKTTALKGIIKGYIDKKLDEDFSNAIFVSFSVFDKAIDYELNHSDINYSYIGVKNEKSQTKSHDELRQEFNDSIFNILAKNRHTYLGSMFDILSSDYNLSEMGIVDILNEYLLISKKEKSNMEELSSNLANKFSELSSGHQIILLSISKIVELIVEKTLIVIDEPETHLHPPLLSSFIRALSKIAITENAVAILATHSPVILQELPKSCVSIVRKFGSIVKISSPRFETFGENIGILTEEVFGLEIPKTGFHTLLRDVVDEKRDYEKVLEMFNYELSIDAKSIIRTYLNELNYD